MKVQLTDGREVDVPKKKLAGWAGAWKRHGVAYMVIVSAPDRDAAVEQLDRIGGFHVSVQSQVKPVTLLPGHRWFPDVPEHDWASALTCLEAGVRDG